jgi:hypothetical protein
VTARNAAGDPTELADANGVQAKLRYGVLGRKRYAWSPSGQSTRWDAAYCTGLPVAAGMPTRPCPSGFGLAYASTTTSSGKPTARVFYDVLGRPTLSLVEGFGTQPWVATITQYDANGNVVRTSEPFFAEDAGASAATPMPGVAILWNQTSYDTIKRPLLARAANGASVTMTYDGLRTTTTSSQNGS